MALVDCVPNSQAVLREILHWTGGQPFLTQKLCDLVQTGISRMPELIEGQESSWVEELVRSRIIANWQYEDNPIHLRTIRDRLLRNEQQAVRLLGIYQQILSSGEIAADDSEDQIELCLSGLVIKQKGRLRVSNRIYQHVFDGEWVNKTLTNLRPYATAITAWSASGCQDRSRLLRGQTLRDALLWAEKRSLGSLDERFLRASQSHDKKISTKFFLGIFAGLLTVPLSIFGTWIFLQYKYASCPIGERIGWIRGSCFRMIITSGEQSRLFPSNTNYHLEEGTKYFSKGDYAKAYRLFDQAIAADQNDPVPWIYRNNAQARLQKNPLKLAVVAGVDYHADIAKEILRGVADAQTEFNAHHGYQGRLLEVVIANDGNELPVSKLVANNLVSRKDILAVTGHHSSESTFAALDIYQASQMPVVSPSSTSSKLNKGVFFRAMQSTKEAAEVYAKYLRNKLGSTKMAIFYDTGRFSLGNNTYSKSLKENLRSELREKMDRAEVITLDNPDLNISQVVKDLRQKDVKVALLISSVRMNSVVIAIAQENAKYPKQERIQLVGVISLSHQDILSRGGAYLEGMILAAPCSPGHSAYMKTATQRWQANEVNWRVTTSYDATKALTQAIRLSQNPTRKNILNQLKSLNLPASETSGFGLVFSDANHSNIKRNYCLFERRNFQLREIKGAS